MKTVIIFILLFFISCENSKNKTECVNECLNEGELFCEENNVYLCEKDESLCLKKTLNKTCIENEICRNSSCILADCVDECFNNTEKKCIDDTKLTVCGNFDEDVCLEKQERYCSENGKCENGVCIGEGNPCELVDCFNGGICIVENNEAYCQCSAEYTGFNCRECNNGYQDNDADTICKPDCQTADLNCNNKGICSDSSGETICVCETGYVGKNCERCGQNYQDNDSNGICLPKCNIAELNCINGDCSDLTGIAKCVCDVGYTGNKCDECISGYQDNDNDGICNPTCEFLFMDCNYHGTCSETTGFAKCTCSIEYTGSNCERCSAKYQDNDNDGICKLNCANSNLICGTNGVCHDISGTAVCQCSTGYTGNDCLLCSENYQDNNNDGICLPKCLSTSCNFKGICSDFSGELICNCDVGYTGNNCQLCELGYHLENSICVKNCINDSECNDSNICNGLEKCNLNTGICENSIPLNCQWGCNNTTGCVYYNSCKELKNTFPALINGFYEIKPSTQIISAYCDMSYDDNESKGWTLIGNVSQTENTPFTGVENIGTNYLSPQYSINANGIIFKKILLTHTTLNLKEKFELKEQSVWNSSNSNIFFQLNNNYYAIFKRDSKSMCCINSTNEFCTNQDKNQVYGAVSSGEDDCNKLNKIYSPNCGGWRSPPFDTNWPLNGGMIFIK